MGRRRGYPSVYGSLGRRRFEQPSQLSVEEVFRRLRPRHNLGQEQLDAEALLKTWASPIPTSVAPGAEISMDAKKHSYEEEVTRGSRPETLLQFQAEQLLASPGTLPQPMSRFEREQVIRTLLPTATYETLSRLPRKLVEADGIEGQTLRRRLVEGSTVVFFSAGYPGKRFVFERAHQLGIQTVIIEHPDSWAAELVDEGIISKFVPLDMSRSADEVLKDALAAIKSLGKDGKCGEADAVLTMVELSVPIVARICEQLGLPGPRPAAVDAARDKHETRAALRRAGLPTPRTHLIKSQTDLATAATTVGFPAVLKPVSGAASLGVKKVESEAELQNVFDDVQKELNSLMVVSGALVQNDGSGAGVQASKVVNTNVLLEQYLDGTEVDVDVVMSEGEWRYAAITDNGPTVEPWFNETWAAIPSLLPLQQQRELKELAVACVKALGFDGGVFHVECKYTSTGPQLIEVNARMGGGPVHEHNIQSWGVDLVEEAIFIALGIPSRPLVPKVPLNCIASYLVPCEVTGIVEEVPDFTALSAREDIVWARACVRVGDKVVGHKDGMPTWIADIMVKDKTPQEALDKVFKMVKEYPVKVKPSP